MMLKPAPYAMPAEKALFYGGWIFTGLVLLFLVAPILAIVPLSFNAEPYFSYPMPGLSLRWYEDFFTNDRWVLALKTSIIVAIFTTMIATALGTLAALGLSRANFPARSSFMSVLIMPMIVPIIISPVGMYFFYTDISLSNSLPGLILAHTALATPFVVIVVTATLSGFDHTLSRAGASLGGTPVTVFKRVILPLILP